MRFYRSFILVVLATFLILDFGSSPTLAGYQILNDWTVEMTAAQSALEYYQRAQVAGPTLMGDAFIIAAPNGELQKRSLKSGEVIWSTQLEGISPSAWAVDGAQVFGGDSKGFIYSVDGTTGKILWKTTSKAVYYSRPLVNQKQVVLMNSAGILQSYDRETGQWQWQQGENGAKNLSLWSFQGPVLFQSYVVSGFPEGQLEAFDLSSGKEIWKESFNLLPGGGDSFNDLKAISSDSNYLLASSFGGDLKAWESTKGSKKLLWSKRISLHAPVSIVSEDEVSFSTRDGAVWLLEGKTGIQKWQYTLKHGLGSQPIFRNGNFWIGTSTGSLVVLDGAGKLVTEDDHYDSPIWNPPLMVNDHEAILVTAKGMIRRVKLVKTSVY